MALSGSRKHFVMAAISALALMSATPCCVDAQTAGGVAHIPSFAKLPDSAIAQFKADPQGLLTTYASAGLPLSTRVRSLVLTDSSLVETLIGVAKCAGGARKAGVASEAPKCANDAQLAAIGAGLAEAARILAAANPLLAAQIQLSVAQSGLGPLITAFIAVSNGTETAAVGGGEGGVGGGSGGATGGAGPYGGANSGANPGGVSFSAVNEASAFGALGSGGGLTIPTSQSTSPSKSTI